MQKKNDFDAILTTYKEYLSGNGLKLTSQRKTILSEFYKAGGHLNADELFHHVKKKDDGVGLASVYRTINSLVECGLAQERKFLNKTSVYELRVPEQHHDHLVCNQCGKIFEFENEKIEALQEEIAKSLGFKLRDHRMELYGDCNQVDCKNLKDK